MTIEEKLQHFMDISVNGAYEKGQQTIKEYKAALDKVFEEHKAEALNTANTYIKTTKSGIKRNISKDFSKQQMDIRHELTIKQEEIKDKIFDEVTTLLEQFQKTEDYNTLLVKYINEAVAIAQDNPIDIFIDPKDSDKLKMLMDLTKCTITINDTSFMGGIKAVIPSKNIIIDNSFESKFDLEKENFVITL